MQARLIMPKNPRDTLVIAISGISSHTDRYPLKGIIEKSTENNLPVLALNSNESLRAVYPAVKKAESAVEHISEALQRLKPRKVILVGHSFGGNLIQIMYGDILRKLKEHAGIQKKPYAILISSTRRLEDGPAGLYTVQKLLAPNAKEENVEKVVSKITEGLNPKNDTLRSSKGPHMIVMHPYDRAFKPEGYTSFFGLLTNPFVVKAKPTANQKKPETEAEALQYHNWEEKEALKQLLEIVMPQILKRA